MNGNVTKEGITADLEAMKAVGIGGAQMFTVDQGIPAGPAKYDGSLWREMTNFAVKEADRLGMELCIHNGAGWSSSGGPWITPENGMQVIAWSELKVTGAVPVDQTLPQPEAPRVESKVPLYREIALFAYPTPAEGDVPPRPADFLARTGVTRGNGLQPDVTPLAGAAPIPASQLVDLTGKLSPDGRLKWDAPAGNWTILRMGYVPTGMHNHPAPPEGDGLEVDKLSRAALDTHWAGMMAKVIGDAGPLAGKSLNNVLIDSYEVGSQNWTPLMRAEFRRRRGYDPLPFLPVVAGRVINSKAESERFLWDLRRTIADLFADNYYGYMRELAHRSKLKFSAEPYGDGGFDTMQSGSKADIPMAEFWLGGGAMETTKMVSSLCHTYGRPIVGAESFTGDDVRGRWLEEPYRFKATGDLAFCNGVNRYIFHRYAMQPWLNLNPGMTMGPWGTHLERTQTWWTEAATWLKYVQRCQYLLQPGRFVADICYYYGENSPVDLPYRNALKPAPPEGYDYDGCDAPTLMTMTVSNGRIMLPSGMSYRLLVLPDTKFMRPEIARKIHDLVAAGATIYGPKPALSPSLEGYPACDALLKQYADGLWGVESRGSAGVRILGKGRVYWGEPLDRVMNDLHVEADFVYRPHNYGIKLATIHRRLGNTEIYFVSNQGYRSTVASCSFRVSGMRPELWHPDTGVIEPAPDFVDNRPRGETFLHLHLAPAESVFVVFRHLDTIPHIDVLLSSSDAQAAPAGKISVDTARYESADGRGADVSAKVREMVAGGDYEIPANNEVFGDPVVNVPKHLVINYRLNGKPMQQHVEENQTIELLASPSDEYEPAAYSLLPGQSGAVEAVAWKPAAFKVTVQHGTHTYGMKEPAGTIDLNANWRITFPPNLGAPSSAFFPNLVSWTASQEPGIRYFSGSALYTKQIVLDHAFLAADRAIRLCLGKVKNFATVSVNGHRVAGLWKPPFTLDVKPYLHVGMNRLDVKVTNLWPNRIIGDEQLPPDVEWTPDGHLAKWPDWLVNGRPRPKTGRITFETWHFYDKSSPLLESGLIGPVTLQSAKRVPLFSPR
jgi:hypothetical protein